MENKVEKDNILNNEKRILGVIPSRYASQRLPNKPLEKICGKEMVIWVLEGATKSGLFNKVVLATDHKDIYNCAIENGYYALMTSLNCKNGTQRVEEAIRILENNGEKYDIVVNIQGDEPLIDRDILEKVILPFKDEDVEICSLRKKIEEVEQVNNPNVVKVVCNRKGYAIYFSRSPLPYYRDKTLEEAISEGIYYKHIGLYAYKREVLKQIVSLPISYLENIEALEQLRWIENNYKIMMSITEKETIGVDTYEDLQRVNDFIMKHF
ncbi:MAG: 3-deoxy-manno-octulosonate cytidylyltransferase [Bacteroidales bacterium]|nr:3-deoxy-manno-octulosonate cytidylyltransferase [Bacteroidales bacterium]